MFRCEKEEALFNHLLNRRSFLKISTLTLLALYDGRLAWARQAVDSLPLGQLSLANSRTGEKLSVTFRDIAGEYDLGALEAINQLLRCHYTGEVHPIDLRTLEILSTVDRKLGGGHEIEVISGYRSPEYNKVLRRKSRRVARQSLHMEGRAVDIRITGVPLKKVKHTAVALQCGGVGYYPRSGFVHLDSGDFRTW